MAGIAILALFWLYITLAKMGYKAAKTTNAKIVVVLLILLIPTADWIYGRIRLQLMCKSEAGIKINKVAEAVQGFMGNTDKLMITKYGYKFVESCDYPVLGHCIRISKPNEDFVKEENIIPKSKYRFRSVYNGKGLYPLSQFLIEDLVTGEVLSSDTQIGYKGGWVEQLIGAFSDAGQTATLWCSQNPFDNGRVDNLILKTLKL